MAILLRERRLHREKEGADAVINEAIGQGLTSRLIADKLFLSLPTIKWYRRRLLMKFDAKNTAEMLFKAREAGLL